MLFSSSISWSRTAFPEVKLMRYIFALLGRLARWSCKQMNKTQAEGSHKVIISTQLHDADIFPARMKPSEAIEKSRSLCTLPKAWQRRCTKMSSSWTWTASKRNATSMTHVYKPLFCTILCHTMLAPNHFSQWNR